MTLTPEIRAWLASVGVRDPSLVRPFSSARTADVFEIDDLVLRWYGRGTLLELQPDSIDREVAVLTALEHTSVPAPRLIAWSDEPPAVLTTRLMGTHRLDLPDPGALRAVLDAIHAADPAPLAAWSYRGYHEGIDLPRPAWWHDPALWEAAVQHSIHARPTGPRVVIHRDLHPDNVLWSGDDITGVVDWGNACLGPAPFDVAHYRVNLATLHGPETADRALAGDPAWDIEASLGFLDWWNGAAGVDRWIGYWPQVAGEDARSRLESFVARAMAALG